MVVSNWQSNPQVEGCLFCDVFETLDYAKFEIKDGATENAHMLPAMSLEVKIKSTWKRLGSLCA